MEATDFNYSINYILFLTPCSYIQCYYFAIFLLFFHSLGSQLKPRPGSHVKHYMLETSALQYRVASYFHVISSIYLITLRYLFYHLYHLHHIHPIISTLFFYIKPSVYIITCFANGHQYFH